MIAYEVPPILYNSECNNLNWRPNSATDYGVDNDSFEPNDDVRLSWISSEGVHSRSDLASLWKDETGVPDYRHLYNRFQGMGQ